MCNAFGSRTEPSRRKAFGQHASRLADRQFISDGTKRQKPLPFSSSEGSVLIFILLRRVRHVRVSSLLVGASFRQYFLVRPFALRDRVVGIDACVRPAAGVDTNPFSCAQWDAFAGEQEAGILH